MPPGRQSTLVGDSWAGTGERSRLGVRGAGGPTGGAECAGGEAEPSLGWPVASAASAAAAAAALVTAATAASLPGEWRRSKRVRQGRSSAREWPVLCWREGGQSGLTPLPNRAAAQAAAAPTDWECCAAVAAGRSQFWSGGFVCRLVLYSRWVRWRHACSRGCKG